MKKWLITTIVLLSLLVVAVAGCTSSGKESTSPQPVSVTRGDLIISVSGSGTMEVARDANLTFGTAGRIDKLLVKEGDKVTDGQIIAQLEADSLDLALAQAEVEYARGQLTVKQYDVAVSQATVAVTQADIGQKSAEIALEQTTKSSSVSDIRIAQADVDTAKKNLADSLVSLTGYTPGTAAYEEYQKNVVLAQARLKAAQDRLDAMLGGFATDEVAVKKQQVTAAAQALTAAKASLEQANLAASLGRQALELAGKSRDYARRQLDKAVIKAPFAGTITKVPVDEKDTVLATSLIAHLIDLTSMELKVQVDEIDIPGVQLGQKAIVKVDALPDAGLIGKVSYISPLPIKEGGVTLFEVKIALDDVENSGLKSGMSANADIVTSERKNILLVPSRVVKQNSDGKSTVTVTADGKTIEKTVVTGITDGFQTEIVSGLQEGETLLDNRAK